MSIPIWRLTKIFVLIKLLQLIIVYITTIRFDTSSEIIINAQLASHQALVEQWPKLPITTLITRIVNKFITWDIVYFSDLYVNDIKFEHQFVFCPNWWRLIKSIGPDNFYTRLIVSVIVSNTCHYLSVLVLYMLTRDYLIRFQRREVLDRHSELASILMIIAPAGIFLTSGYSEVFSNLLSFTAIYLHNKSFNHQDFSQANNKSIRYVSMYVILGILTAYNFTIRANLVLLGVLYLYDLYEFVLVNQNWTQGTWAIITGSQIFLSIVNQNWISYRTFCPQRGEWCENRIPSLFQYAQDHYWNVGFMKYWTPNNIPNFILASPLLVIHGLAIRHYIKELPKIKKIMPLVLINCLLMVGAIFFWNVQIFNRISSFLPLSYWYVGQLILEDDWRGRAMAYFMIIYGLLQTSLFAAFLPPA